MPLFPDRRSPTRYLTMSKPAFIILRELHRQLGSGFLEAVYQEALALEFDLRQVPYQREVELSIFYKDRRLVTHYRADFICYDTVIGELKALSKLGGVEQAQIINYLKATGLKTGLLLNFGAASLEYRRFIHSNAIPPAQSAKSA